MLMGHTDVVPVNVDGWSRDPFGGGARRRHDLGPRRGRHAQPHVDDGGRVPAPRRVRASRRRARCSYLAVADEEALGTWGAKYLVEHELDEVQRRLRDHRVRRLPGADRERAPGSRSWWRRRAPSGRTSRCTARRATPRRRTAPTTRSSPRPRSCAGSPSTGPRPSIGDTWRGYVDGLGLPEELADPGPGFDEFVAELPLGLARIAHSCTHTTMAPTVAHGGTKTNIIPDRVDLAGRRAHACRASRGDAARALLMDAIGDLADKVEIDVERRSRHRVADRHAAVGRRSSGSPAGSARARRWCPRS